MIFTDYYRFEKTAVKAKNRLDCTCSTHSYNTLERLACRGPQRPTEKRDGKQAGDITLNLFTAVPMNYSRHAQIKAWKVLKTNAEPLTSIYKARGGLTPFAYGDFRGSCDGILFYIYNYTETGNSVDRGTVVEMFIARGCKHNITSICKLAEEGDFDEELQLLRAKATPIHKLQP